MKRKMKVAAISLLLLALCACNNKSISKDKRKMKEINEITYRFGDSSVPPPYHRSYSIVLNAETATVTIDSYGDIIAKKEYKVEKHTLDKMLELFTKCKIANCKEKKNDGCTGGTSESIWQNTGSEKTFYGSVYHCGGKKYGTLEGDINKFADAMKALIPDLKELKNK